VVVNDAVVVVVTLDQAGDHDGSAMLVKVLGWWETGP